MSLIEGVGDEVTHFFIAFFVILFVTAAWWTTNISEQRHLRLQTVFLIDRRLRRRGRTNSRLTNHTQSATLVEAASDNAESDTMTVSTETGGTAERNADKPDEPGTSVQNDGQSTSNAAEEEEQSAIVETMDAVNCVLRQRRIAFFENRQDTIMNYPDGVQTADQSELLDSSYSSSVDDTDEPVLMEHNYANNTENSEQTTPKVGMPEQNPTEDDESSLMHVKLKYINDDLRIVDGTPNEPLGDFKRRHFEEELSSNKLVRLIFNGKVLQEDTKTLRGCGLFDNCVVHCLIHPKRVTLNEANASESTTSFGRANSRSRIPNLNENNNQARESDLGNILFALISFILGSAWYFRYVYAHLYTVTATVALVAVTGIFTVLIIGMYFPDHEATPPPNAENTQR